MPHLSRRFRLLPVLVATSSLVLATKLFDVANGVDRILTSSLTVGTAHAETAHAETAKPEHAAPKPGQANARAAEAMPVDRPPVDGQAGSGTPVDARPAQARPVPDKPLADQPPLPSPQELQVLQSLTQRREALDERAQELERRGDLLQAAEARIDRKLGEMKDMQAALLKLIRTHDEQQEEKTRSLVKIYENMKPRDASRIFEQLDMDTLLPVVERMNERKLAPVLASMNPLKAKTITEELARLRQLASQNNPEKSG